MIDWCRRTGVHNRHCEQLGIGALEHNWTEHNWTFVHLGVVERDKSYCTCCHKNYRTYCCRYYCTHYPESCCRRWVECYSRRCDKSCDRCCYSRYIVVQERKCYFQYWHMVSSRCYVDSEIRRYLFDPWNSYHPRSWSMFEHS
jgi:hypothetical protein